MEAIDSSRLVVVILHTSQLERSLRFYRDLIGLPLEPGHNEPDADPWYGGHHAELSWREGAYLHFALFPSKPPSHRVTSGAEIGLRVASLPEVHKRLLESGAEVLHGPRVEPWGETARYLDPDANIVGITAR
jgi:catechol 2,3-dioxygenase-like lactoylglutathione lyase family enzyme